MEVFWDAIENNNTKELLSAIKKENIPKSIKDSFGYSPLHIAISKGNNDVCKILIENLFECNIQDKKSGQTPLHYCAYYDNLEIASLLLQNKGKLDIADNYGNEPLWTAVFNDKGFGLRVEMVKLFLENGANKFHINNVGLSPIEMAVSNRYKAIADLLENG